MEPLTDDRIVFSSKRISPDNDGYQDLLVIDMKFAGNGNVVTITVFNETGGFVKKLAGNLLAGTNASVTWDGTADDGSLVNPGIYIFLISVFDDTGKKETWKRVCAVIR
jgi:flagellar hook assembly protein FlgD